MKTERLTIAGTILAWCVGSSLCFTRRSKPPRQLFFAHDVNLSGLQEDSILDRMLNEDCACQRRSFLAALVPLLSTISLPTSAALPNQERSPLDPYNVSMVVATDENDVREIVIEVIPRWAPLSAERFQALVDDNFFTDCKVFRVLPGYVAQFGIAGNPELNKKWMFDQSKVLKDEPRLHANRKGTLSFASSGKNSRRTQIFINLSNNDGPPNFLDAQGFVPFARVVKGLDDVAPHL